MTKLGRGEAKGLPMADREQGFSMLELLAALLIMGIIAAMALPMAITAVKGYRLHADATALASYLNVVRMRAASQYAPYCLNIDASLGQYTIEKLCGSTPSSVDSACTGAYQQFTVRQFEYGTQYGGSGDTFSSCRPAGVTQYPLSTMTADPSGCSTALQFYFNTRGLPVDNTGSILTNGGNVVYLKNRNNLIDAVTISMGGRVAIYNWSPSASTWVMR